MNGDHSNAPAPVSTDERVPSIDKRLLDESFCTSSDVWALRKEAAAKIREMFRLLLEARDALPAIPLASARLRNLDLSLADRIETAMEPWLVRPGEPGYDEAI